MAEGDAIRKAAARIGEALAGKQVVRAAAPSPRSPARVWAGRLEGKRLTDASARGKHLFLDFEGAVVHSHLRMSGAWHIYREGEWWRRAQSAAWLVLEAGDLTVVQFNGPVLELVSRRKRAAMRLGPDPLDEGFSPALAQETVRRAAAGRRLGEVLLDQRAIAGIGNIHKSEACFAAAVDPWKPVEEMPPADLQRVIEAARDSLVAGLSKRRSYAVYRHRGRPCVICATPILSRPQGDDNRMTYWCPNCQA